MKTSAAVKFYKNRNRIAAVLGITRSAVYQWGAVVPEVSAYRLAADSDGKLKVDPRDYGRRPAPKPGSGRQQVAA